MRLTNVPRHKQGNYTTMQGEQAEQVKKWYKQAEQEAVG
jgi:hypothetical protein